MPPRYSILLLTLVALALLSWRLGERPMWEDEAETALLGANTLRFGLPLADNGTHEIRQPWFVGGEWQFRVYPVVDENGVFVWLPWLSFYAIAASFWLFGQTTFAARLPFALAAAFAVPAAYALAREGEDDERTAFCASLLLTFSLQFLIYARQCRPYTLAAPFVPLMLVGYLRALRSARGGAALLAGSSALLYYSNPYLFFGAWVALAVHWLAFGQKRAIRSLGVAAAVCAALTLPYFLYSRPWQVLGDRTVARAQSLWILLSGVSYTIFPSVLWAGIPLVGRSAWSALLLLTFACATGLMAWFSMVPRLGYLAGLFPVMAVLASRVINHPALGRGRAPILILAASTTILQLVVPAAFTVATNGPGALPGALELVECPMWVYGQEMALDYPSPMKGLIDFLARNSKPGEILLTDYDWEVVAFYLPWLRIPDRKLYNRHNPELLTDEFVRKAAWIVPRHHPEAPLFPKDWLWTAAKGWREHRLPYPDFLYANYPDRLWRSEYLEGSPNLVIFENPARAREAR